MNENSEFYKETAENLKEFNKIVKESDVVYRSVAKKSGLPRCVFWVLYIMRDNKEGLTQSEICAKLFHPKQTVNSAIKKLETDGYIMLEVGDDRRSRRLVLTESGEELAERVIDTLVQAEINAMGHLPLQRQREFLRLFSAFNTALAKELQENS